MTVGADTRDLHRCFRQAMTALAYPGRYTEHGCADSATAVEHLVAALYPPDARVCRIHGSNAGSLAPGDAELVLVQGVRTDGLLSVLARGDEKAPQDGATVIYDAGGHYVETRCLLAGPGVPGAQQGAKRPLPVDELYERNAACAVSPLGIDLWVVGPRRLLGLPRSTSVTVVG
jgi:alpha-D-ribose 1-methylphosphonate 5-triphosphate synthase subunit PhnH